MNDTTLTTIEQVEVFLSAAHTVQFEFESQAAGYAWVQATLSRLGYLALGKRAKGIVRRYVLAVTGYSRAQGTRLIRQYRRSGCVQRRNVTRPRFKRTYTPKDVRLLAKTDELHGTLSGPATKKIFERAFSIFGEADYERLAAISVGHLYNLRHSLGYRKHRQTYTKTHSRKVQIGARRKPQPNGAPGYLRIDSVHQGDLDGKKGVYHINAVDEVTQFQAVVCVEKISEAYLLAALDELFAAFPFVIRGFHSDNGSEYVNYQVAKLLNKLLIEFTKSRSRKTNERAAYPWGTTPWLRASMPRRFASTWAMPTFRSTTPHRSMHSTAST